MLLIKKNMKATSELRTLGRSSHRGEEHGEEVDHGLHVEAPLGGHAGRRQEHQAADGRKQHLGDESPHDWIKTSTRCECPSAPLIKLIISNKTSDFNYGVSISLFWTWLGPVVSRLPARCRHSHAAVRTHPAVHRGPLNFKRPSGWQASEDSCFHTSALCLELRAGRVTTIRTAAELF